MKKLDIYTDGSCFNNGKGDSVGGWGIVITNGTKIKEKSGGELDATNNKMELTAVLEALKYFDENKSIDKNNVALRIFCDSAYVINGINQRWVKKWINNGWRTSKNTPVENKPLWEKINEYDKRINFQIIKVKAHADNELNNRCDALAKSEVEKLKNINEII